MTLQRSPSPSRPPVAMSSGWVVGLIVVLAASTAAVASAPSVASQMWQQIATLRFDEAVQLYEASDPAVRSDEADLALAVALLNRAPITAGNVERARTLVRELAAGQGPWAPQAAYLHARILHLHLDPPQPEAARAAYEQLAADHPAHPLGQMAVVRAGLLRLLGPGGLMDLPAQASVNATDTANADADAGPDPRVALFEQVAATGEHLTDRAARRAFHAMLADVATLTELPGHLALQHLLALDELGTASQKRQADLWVRIAELSRGLGNTARAVAYYRRFVEAFPRDPRAYLAEQIVDQLEAGVATSSVAPNATPPTVAPSAEGAER